MVQQTVRTFVDRELIPVEMQSDVGDAITPERYAEFHRKVREMGLWQFDVPERFGGGGLGLLERCIIQEEIGRTKALPFRHNELFGPTGGAVLYHCQGEQVERFLLPVLRGEQKVCFAQTEPEGGADPAGMRTTAVRDGDDYVINGTKRFITGAARAHFAQVIALTDPEKRAHGGISCIIVPMHTPGVKLVRADHTMMGDEPWEIHFDNVRVPVANRIGEEGAGFRLAQEWLTVNRIKIHGAYPVGIARRALEMAMEYAKVRKTFGQPLSQRQVIQFMLADSAMEIEAARLLVLSTAWQFDQGQDVRDRSYMVKIVCTEMASRVVDRAIQIHGGVGLTTDLPLEYWYRQLRSIRITEGATEVLRWRLARSLLTASPGSDRPAD
ncbi:MAG: acyl-CoA dehydrogenase [Myxococcales bacterium]|nr:acyl-CoA dehydrogenase [Myxococcales bacterium]